MARILFYSNTAPYGGHLRSAIAIGTNLRQRGHHVIFITGKGPGAKLIIKNGFRHIELPYPAYKSQSFNWRNSRFLMEVAHRNPHEIINSFQGGVIPLSHIAGKVKSRLVVTLCGGKPSRIFTRMSPVTVFSSELRDWLIDYGVKSQYLFLIPGRMDVNIADIKRPKIESFKKALNLKQSDTPIILMVCRLDPSKKRAIKFFFNGAKQYAKTKKNGLFLLVGSGNNKNFENRIRLESQEVNREVGYRILISTAMGSDEPVSILPIADIVVGMGRSAFEGMAFNKPTFIVSNEGFGGLVNEKTITQIAHTNFTARYQKDKKQLTTSVFISGLNMVIEDPQLYHQSGKFAGEWFQKNLDAKKAAAKYEYVYFNLPPEAYQPPRKNELVKRFLWQGVRSIWHGIKNT